MYSFKAEHHHSLTSDRDPEILFLILFLLSFNLLHEPCIKAAVIAEFPAMATTVLSHCWACKMSAYIVNMVRVEKRLWYIVSVFLYISGSRQSWKINKQHYCVLINTLYLVNFAHCALDITSNSHYKWMFIFCKMSMFRISVHM